MDILPGPLFCLPHLHHQFFNNHSLMLLTKLKPSFFLKVLLFSLPSQIKVTLPLPMLQKHQKWDLSSILLIPNHYFKITILMSFLPYRQKISTPLCNFLPQLLGLVVHNKFLPVCHLFPWSYPELCMSI